MTASSGAPRSNGDSPGAQTERWNEILNVAADVIYEKGYSSTTIQDIANRVGMLKGSLYYYIRTKEDFLFGIIDEVQVRGLEVLEEVRRLNGDPVQRLHAFVERYARFTIENRVKASVFDRDFRSLSPERKQQLVRERDLYDEFVRSILREGMQADVFAAELDVVVVSNVIFQTVNSVYRWYNPDGSRSVDEISRMLADFAIGGAGGRLTQERCR